MALTADEIMKLKEIEDKHAGNIRLAVALAYEEGLLTGALRTAQRLGAELQAGQRGANMGSGDDAEDENSIGPLTEIDKRNLIAMGLDPSKTYIHKNSRLTITGYKPSRWKYPISITNQNGRKLKCAAGFLKNQCRIV